MSNVKGIDFAKMKRRLEKNVGKAFAKLHDFVPVTASLSEDESPSIFKVVATLSGIDKALDRESIYRAIASATNNMAAPIENSFREIPGTRAFVGFVARNGEVRPYETAAVENMKVMSSNLLMDEDDHSLWEVRSGGDAKFLVRHQEDDLTDLMALASVRTINRELDVPVLSKLGYSEPRVNECVVFVNKETASVSHGMVIGFDGDNLKVVNMDTKETATVHSDYIVESATFNFDQMKEEFKEVAAPDTESVLSMEDYWFKVFGGFPAYWAEFKKMLDSRATV